MKIAVLLTVHNRKEKTLQCLQQLYAQEISEDVSLKVYLTNDACTDGTPEALEALYPDVYQILGDGNLYWNRGMWTAWQVASQYDYDYYLWLNDDTFLYPQAVAQALCASKEKENRAIIVGATHSQQNQEVTYGLCDPATKQRLVPNGKLQLGENLNGNFVLIPREVYQRLGNLDYTYVHAGGDTDYGLRAQAVGIGLYLDKKYVGVCEAHDSLPKCFDPKVALSQRWKHLHQPTGMPLGILFYMTRKHYGYFRALSVMCTTCLHCLCPKLWMKLKNS